MTAMEAIAGLMTRVAALEAAICHCPDCTMHREKARHASEAAVALEGPTDDEVLDLAAVLWAELHQRTYGAAKAVLAHGDYYSGNYMRMARRVLEHLPYLKKLRS